MGLAMIRASISRASYRSALKWEKDRQGATYHYRPALCSYDGRHTVRFVFAMKDDQSGKGGTEIVMPTRVNQGVTFTKTGHQGVELEWIS